MALSAGAMWRNVAMYMYVRRNVMLQQQREGYFSGRRIVSATCVAFYQSVGVTAALAV